MFDREYERKKIDILEIAEELFCRFGSKNTTVRLIAKKANISPAMLNYYFGSKENLFLLIFENKIKQFKESMTSYIIRDEIVSVQLFNYANFYINLIVDNIAFYRLMMREKLLNENERVVNLIDSYFKSNMQVFRSILDKGIDEKKIENIDADIFTMILSGVFFHLVFNNGEVIYVLDLKEIVKIKQHIKEVILRFLVQ